MMLGLSPARTPVAGGDGCRRGLLLGGRVLCVLHRAREVLLLPDAHSWGDLASGDFLLCVLSLGVPATVASLVLCMGTVCVVFAGRLEKRGKVEGVFVMLPLLRSSAEGACRPQQAVAAGCGGTAVGSSGKGGGDWHSLRSSAEGACSPQRGGGDFSGGPMLGLAHEPAGEVVWLQELR